jgi:hypothetical protein
MKLSDLVRKYNQICDWSSSEIKNSVNQHLLKILHVSDQPTELDQMKSQVMQALDDFDTVLTNQKQIMHDHIRDQERSYLQQSYKVYEENRDYRYEWFKMELTDQVPDLAEQLEIQQSNISRHVQSQLNKRLDISDVARDLILNRIIRCCGWQNTAMILRPSAEMWIQHMVGCDPLYIVDEDHELLKPAMSQFNELYQQRLRPYVIREDQDRDILWQLPDNQFGLILAWGYFDHRPFEVIKRYLTELYKKTRAGGMVLMTYNDCDRWPGVVAAEVGTGLYTPGSFVKNFAESLGFETSYEYHEDGTWTWIELRKPGMKASLRGGQALAKIIPKPVAKSK